MINLLHQNIKESRKINRRFMQLSVFFSIVLLLALSTWGALIYSKTSLEDKNKDLDGQISTVTTSLIKYRDLEKKITLSNNRLDQIAGLQSTRKDWAGIITSLANNTPANIQINNLTIGLGSAGSQSDSTSYQFTLSATAKTLDDIETFRKTLDGSGSFSDTTFQSATFNPDTNGFTFNLTTQLKQT